jgi:hypothetical protein
MQKLMIQVALRKLGVQTLWNMVEDAWEVGRLERQYWACSWWCQPEVECCKQARGKVH